MFWPFSKSYQERKLQRDSYVQEKEKHNQVLQMRIDKCKHKVDAGKKIIVKKAPMVRKKTANKSTQVALLTDKSKKGKLKLWENNKVKNLLIDFWVC